MIAQIHRERDNYIDFLRSIGLLLLIGVHVNAPEWYKPLRSFDVPLMVFISALCYKPLRGGYLAYAIKRFKRIYIPVFIFLTLFFLAVIVAHFTIGLPLFSFSQIIGSYLLLNNPSIGYVWIMRVFLLMALLIPLLVKVLENKQFGFVITAILGFIILQSSLVVLVGMVTNKVLNFILDEVVLYAIGYAPLAILGLKIKDFQRYELLIFLLICGSIIIWFIYSNGWLFNPNKYKYPPESLYLLYGLFASCLLWCFKGIITPYISDPGFKFLSRNSMWIYLWHIIPVYLITPIDWIENTWFLRYMIVVFVAIGLYWLYSKFIIIFPDKVRKLLQ